MRLARAIALILCFIPFLLPVCVGAAPAGPGWHQSPRRVPAFETAPAPASAERVALAAFTMPACDAEHPNSGNAADAQLPEIRELAAGLRHDPVQIYTYVKNHIAYEHYYGAKKGALLTLLEGSGNDFDQSALLVALLRAAGAPAGVQNVQYRFGVQSIAYSHADEPDLVEWLGLAPTAYPGVSWTNVLAQHHLTQDPWPDVSNVQRKKNMLLATLFLQSRGTPNIAYEAGLTRLQLPRVWVQVTINGTTYELDPALKRHEVLAGLDLKAETGYDRTALRQAVGGSTSMPHSVKGINEAALATTLTTYTTQLQARLRQIAPQATPVEVIGGLQPLSEPITSLPATLPLPTVGTSEMWECLAETYNAKLHLTLGTASLTMLLPELQGKKLTLTFAGDTASLWIEDEATPRLQITVTGPTVDVTLLVDHPHALAQEDGTIDDTVNDQAETKTYKKGDTYAYALVYGFTPSGQLLQQRQWRLDQAMRAATLAYPGAVDAQGRLVVQQLPDPVVKRQIVTELLHIVGLQWLYQTALSERLIAAQLDILPLAHHRFGRVAQEEGYYIDVGLQTSDGQSRTGKRADEVTAFTIANYFASAMEHGVIEQMPGTGNTALSTIKLLQLANRSTDTTRDELLLANADTFAAVRPRLQGYASDDLDAWQAQAQAGATFLLTEHAAYTLNEWTGTGHIAFTDTPQALRITMSISGGLQGGENSRRGHMQDDAHALTTATRGEAQSHQRGTSVTGVDQTTANAGSPSTVVRDPVDMASGALVMQHADLTLGEPAPRGLHFVRAYHSGRRYQDEAHLGAGWRHNYASALIEYSAFKAGLGATTPAEMAPYLVATMAAIDIYHTGTTVSNTAVKARAWATAALIAAWGVDQLRQNAVSITLGSDTLQFIRLPNGTYQAPAGVTMTLTRAADGSYVLRERLGNTYRFVPSSTGHRLATITDPDGLTLTCTYDGSGRLATITDAYGRRVTLTYTNGRLTEVRDSTGRAVTYTYNQGRLQTVSDLLGPLATFVYDTDHRLTVVKDALGREVTCNTYDSAGRVMAQSSPAATQTTCNAQRTWRFAYSGVRNTLTDPLGGTTTYLYDLRGRALGIIDALGHQTTLGYDGQDHLVSRTTPKGETTRWTYDADHRLREVRDPLDATTTYHYDDQHRPTQLTRSDPASGGGTRVTMLTYDTGNATARPDTVTDPRGLRTRSVYNADGTVREVREERTSGTYTTSFTYSYFPNGGPLQTLRVTAPDGTFTETTYDQRGDVVAARDANGLVTTHTYNARRQRTSTTPPDGGGTTYTYDAVGDLVEVRSPRGVVTRSTYSPTGKLLTVTTAADTTEAQTVTHTYDARDWRVATRNAASETVQFTYDAAERLVAVRDPLGRVTQYTVDANGQRTALRQPATTRTTQWTYNARGQRVTQTAPDGAVVTWQYTAFDDLQALTPPGQGPYTFTTDANGQLLTTRTPRGFVTTQTWTDRHRLASVQSPAGRTTTFTYDAQGRIATQSDGLGTRTFTYDAAGNVYTVQEGTAVSTRTYDTRHRVTSYTDARSRTVQYAYDLHGNLTQLTYPDGKTVTYTYDRHDRLVMVRDWANRITRYIWDPAHRLTRLERPNGTTQVLTYDQAGQLVRVEERDAEGVLLAGVQLAYDADGYPRQHLVLPMPPVLAVPAVTLTVDADNRVTTVNNVAVTHDADG